jgi:hypothetical protein
MSWIVGIIGESIPPETIAQIKKLSAYPLKSIDVPSEFFAMMGGNNQTLHCIHHNDDSYTLITGLGIAGIGHSSSILTSNEWEKLTASERPNIGHLNGHFTIVQYHNHSIECFSDRVGLRTLYFARSNHGWVFSSRLSWIRELTDHSAIDWGRFGSKWLCGQPFSYDAPLENVQRLPPNGSAVIRQSQLSIRSSPWIELSSAARAASAGTVDTLQHLLSISDKKIKLGLSGGLDSRVLLSFLRSRHAEFSAYAFGSPDEPDIQLAQRMCRDLNIPFQLLDDEFPTQDGCLSLVTQSVRQSNITGPASSTIRLRWYPALAEKESVVIDGGNGEIARRQFFTLLKLKASKFIYNGDAERLFPYLTAPRPDIFTPETNRIMEQGAISELTSLFQFLPQPEHFGIDTFLDLLAATMRIPNIACDEQARIDEHLVNFMPFSQPDFIASALRLPVAERQNNRLFKLMIRQNDSVLARYPLVKNNTSYPYGLSTLQSRLYIKGKDILMRKKPDPDVHVFLGKVKSVVFDTLLSQSVKNYPHYNYQTITRCVERYFAGEKKYAAAVDWWFAFELWRRNVEK